MKRIGLMIFLACVAFAAACTSSNATNNNISTNSGWDSQYRQESRTAQNQERTEQGAEIPRENPPITIMLVSMETGDVYPGEDYNVYAVVDNPDNRDLEYVWSVADGDVREVPESDRGALMTLIEDEYATASATPPAAEQQPAEGGQVPAEGAFGQPGAQQQPGGTGQPPTQQPPAGTGAQPGQQPGVTQTTTPEGSQLPGQQPSGEQATSGGEPQYREPLGPSGGGTTQTYTGGNQQPVESEQQPATTEPIEGNADLPPSPAPTAANPADQEQVELLWSQIQEIERQIQDAYARDDQEGARMLDEERRPLLEQINPLLIKPLSSVGGTASLPPTQMLGYVLERRVVSGEEDEDEDDTSENVELLARQLAEGVTAVGADIAQSGEEELDETAGNVAEGESAGGTKSWVGEPLELGPARDTSLRSQYNVWKEGSEEPRRRNLGGYGDLDETEPLQEEESFEGYTFTTGEPFIQWTPRLPGMVNIYVKATYKGEDMTLPRKLEVEVRLRDPEVTLSEEFPDVVREDDPLYVAIEGQNIPTFWKGLFTLTFDPNRLSFRDAELGEYFDDAPDASLFYAEPDKMAGKVLLAVDSNLKVGELGGNGPLVYVMFKAKQDLTDRADTQLAMVMDTAARYILDRNGENVLPLPVESAPFRTATTMPGELSEYQLAQRPGEGAGQTPVLGQQQLPQQQGRQGTGGTYVPPSGAGTYIPPATTGGTGGTTQQQPTTGGTQTPTTGPSMGQAAGQGIAPGVQTTDTGGGSTPQEQPTTQQPTDQQNREIPPGTDASPGGALVTSEAEGEEGTTTSEEETASTEDGETADSETAADDEAESDEEAASEDESAEPEPEPEPESSSSDS